MNYPTRDECVAEAVKCIDRAFAEKKHAVVVYAQIADAPAADFTVCAWSGDWLASRAVTTFAAFLLPYMRLCYQGIPESPLREADRIICEFAAEIKAAEEHLH